MVESGLLLGVITVVMFAALALLKEQGVAGYSRVDLSLPMI